MSKDEENDGGSSEEEEYRSNESARIDKDDKIVNVDDMDSDDEPIGMRFSQGITKRLKNKRVKANTTAQNQPTKAAKKGASVGPAKS